MGDVAEAITEKLLNVAQLQTRFGNFDLDILAPVVLKSGGGPIRLSRGLELVELIEKPLGYDAARQPFRRSSGGTENASIRRPRSSCARHAIRGEPNGYSRAGKHREPLQRKRHAIFPTTHSQVCELQFPLLVQMFGLDVDQATLIPQESSSFRIHFRAFLGMICRPSAMETAAGFAGSGPSDASPPSNSASSVILLSRCSSEKVTA